MAYNLVESKTISVETSGENIRLKATGDFGNENVVVGSIRTKNMFNKTNIIDDAFINGSTNKIDTSNTTKCVYVEIEGGKTYTVSKTAGTRFAVGTSTVFPEIDTTLSGVIQNYTSSQITISTSSTAKYLVAYVYNSDTDTITLQQMLDSIQIEEGSTATTYSPYQNLDGYDNYSTEEQIIGTWIDGKTLYRKTLYFASNGGGTGEVSYTLSNYGITNVDTIFITHPSFYSNNLNGYRNPFQYYDGSKFSCGVSATTLNVTLGYAPISNSPFVITLEYTKTTD